VINLNNIIVGFDLFINVKAMNEDEVKRIILTQLWFYNIVNYEGVI